MPAYRAGGGGDGPKKTVVSIAGLEPVAKSPPADSAGGDPVARALAAARRSSVAEDLSIITEQCRRDLIECLPALIRIVSDPEQKAADVLRALQMLAHFAGLDKRFGELVDDAVTARVDTTSLSPEELSTLSRLLDRVDLLTD